MPQFTIWTLNRATTLIAQKEKYLRKLFSDRERQLFFGDRSDPEYNAIETDYSKQTFVDTAIINKRTYAGPPSKHGTVKLPRGTKKELREAAKHRLMFESDEVDEYFVPIPLKVIGNPSKIDRSGLSAYQLSNLNKILNSPNNAYFNEGNERELTKYWEKDGYSTDFPRLKMNTDPSSMKGYYQILRDYQSKNPDNKNILIGYSQGGLVAQFIAAVDEHVFGEDLVHGVVTVASPNLGSPLANECNSNEIVNGIFQLVAAIFGVTVERFPHFHSELHHLEAMTVKDISGIFDAIIADMKSEKKPIDGIVSLKKWLTGATGDTFTAFHNLQIQQIYDPGSTLGFIHNHGINRALMGAVINANQDFKNFISNLYPNAALLDLFLGGINLKYGSSVYSNYIMNEDYEVLKEVDEDSTIKRFINERFGGLYEDTKLKLEGEINPYDHDFVIPSNRMLARGGENVIGNLVNEDSNHLTGSDRNFPAGKKNYELIEELLIRMVKKS